VSLVPKLEDARVLYGAAPISDAAPAGADVRAAPEFEELEAEIRRMESEGPNAVDWRKLGSGSLKILSSQSKDLLVAAWAAASLYRTEGYVGLAVGLGIIRGMVDAYWDGMFPPLKRERARVAAVDWFAGRVAPLIAASAPSDADYPAIIAAYDDLDELDRSMGAKLQKEQLSLGDLFRALKPFADQARRAIKDAEEKAEAAARAAEQAAQNQAAAAEQARNAPAPSPAAAPVVTAAPVAIGDWTVFAATLPDNLRQAAIALRTDSYADPRAYLFNRIGSWLRIDALPPDDGGTTGAYPPDDEIAVLEGHRQAGRHAEALIAAEDLVWQAPFYLDAHRHACDALGALGPAFEAARAAVHATVALLVTRYPTILSLSFGDGRPFADPATRAWASFGGGGGAAASSDAMDDAMAVAKKLFAEGEALQALAALARPMASAPNGRTRFAWQLAQAAFCVERGLIMAALPLLDHLDAVAAERGLDAWEPELALRAAELRFRALAHSEALQLVDDVRRRAAFDSIRTRIARLDIGVAARLGQA